MAYARFSEGDVYIYQNFNKKYVCCACQMQEVDDDFICKTAKDMLNHLQMHISEKHIIPERCLKSLQEIANENS